MITTESTNRQFRRYFDENRGELVRRTANLIKHRYKETIIRCVKLGIQPPTVFGLLKLEEVTFYALPIGFNERCEISDLSFFLIMKDLRKQTKVLVTNTTPHTIIFNAHAVRRYRERLNLDENTDFIDICKHMVLNGCARPRIVADFNTVHGANINHRNIQFICCNGAFMGYYSGDTDMLYAETFLSSNEFYEDQLYLDATKSAELKMWRENHEKFAKGEITSEELKSQSAVCERIVIENGRIRRLSPEDIIEDDAKRKEMTENNPNYFTDQIEDNRDRYNNKLKHKGYK